MSLHLAWIECVYHRGPFRAAGPDSTLKALRCSMLRRFVRTALLLATLLAALLFRVHSLGGAAPGGRVVDILTFHGDVGRIGWNPDEQTLTPSTVHSGSFGRLWTRACGRRHLRGTSRRLGP